MQAFLALSFVGLPPVVPPVTFSNSIKTEADPQARCREKEVHFGRDPRSKGREIEKGAMEEIAAKKKKR